MEDSRDDSISLPTADELEVIQKQHPDTIIAPMNAELFERGREEYQQRQKDEEELPILKQTQESLQFFSDRMEAKSQWSLFLDRLEYTPIKSAITEWLTHLNKGTSRNYAYYMSDLIRRNIIPELDAAGNAFTIGHFRHVPHEATIDFIKKVEGWEEGTRQVRAACYISFTGYLERISRGWFRKAEPSMLPSNKTFFSVRDKCATKALTLHEWYRFIEALYEVNERDALIAKTMLQGAKRISEVLSLTVGQIDFEKRIIHFRQSKTGGTIREIPITYPQHFMDELRGYIESTEGMRGDDGIIFITNRGKRVFRTQLNATFNKASKMKNLPKISPHVLRTTWVTLAKEQDIPDSEIMKVTGHTSSKMIYAYDKTSAEDNFSKKLVLI